MIPSSRDDRSPPLLFWPLAVGGVGFLAGFFGPIIFVPEANQGPLLGIFITGPGGAALGLVLGVICRVLPLSARRRWHWLQGAGATMGLVTLWFCMPEPELRGYVVDAEVQACRTPVEALDSAFAYWDRRIVAVTWAEPRAAWKSSASRQASESDGVIVDVIVMRKNGIYEHRKPWNRGRISALGWRRVHEPVSYLVPHASGSCDAYVAGRTLRAFPHSESSAEWPPLRLANFLDAQEMLSVPATYERLVDE